MDEHLKAEEYYNLGVIHYNNKEFKEAIDCFNKAIELNPDSSETYYKLGSTYYEMQEFDEAINFLEMAIELNPDSSKAHYGLGSTHYEKQEFYEAINCLEEAIKLNSNYPEAYYKLGSIYYDNGKFDEAINYLKEAIKLKPVFPGAYNGVGVIYAKNRKFDEAVNYLLIAIKQRPNYPKAYNNLGLVYYENGQRKFFNKTSDFNNAIESFREVLKLRPNDPNTQMYISSCYLEMRKWNEAIDNAQKALSNESNSKAELYYILGKVNFMQKNYAPSIDFYKKAIECSIEKFKVEEKNLSVKYPYKDLAEITSTLNDAYKKQNIDNLRTVIIPVWIGVIMSIITFLYTIEVKYFTIGKDLLSIFFK